MNHGGSHVDILGIFNSGQILFFILAEVNLFVQFIIMVDFDTLAFFTLILGGNDLVFLNVGFNIV